MTLESKYTTLGGLKLRIVLSEERAVGQLEGRFGKVERLGCEGRHQSEWEICGLGGGYGFGLTGEGELWILVVAQDKEKRCRDRW